MIVQGWKSNWRLYTCKYGDSLRGYDMGTGRPQSRVFRDAFGGDGHANLDGMIELL
jgi:hypothetical protein